MKISRETKAQFFSQNLGCYIWDNRDGEFDLSQMQWIVGKADVDRNIWVKHEKDTEYFLLEEHELDHYSLVKSPLSEITPEDDSNCVKTGLQTEYLEEGWRTKGTEVIFHYKLRHTEYLKSKDYALPWNGLSVNQQVISGLIVLRGGVRG